MLCACTLKNLVDNFLLKTMETDGYEETLLDRAMDWLDAMCDEYPGLAEKKTELMKQAAAVTDAWETRQLASINETKSALTSRGINVRNFFEKKRIQALIADTMMRAHETFSAFVAPPTHPVMRWQRWIVIFTLILGVLTVDIWLFWNRGFQCWCGPRCYLTRERGGRLPSVLPAAQALPAHPLTVPRLLRNVSRCPAAPRPA